MKTTVIVPTYNERENIERLVRLLLALPGEINTIIVDDGSPDGTGAIVDALAEEYPSRVEVIHRSGKLGLGTAYIAGFRHALAGDSALICTMDADFSHPPANIPEMVAKAAVGYDLVIGSRYVPDGRTVGCTPPRIALSWGANAFARVLLGLRAHDTTAGFRCYRRAVLEQAPLDQILSNGYSFLIEMLYHVQCQGWKVGEVPITFENRREGTSKISKSEITKALATVLRLFGQRLKNLGRKAPQVC
ncbi:MAG: polyprenol monophosphomannose synthase [Anaerolineae bacterium]|nr:polyprenol monophosphomannose synthase [Anaerolineae bacterium]